MELNCIHISACAYFLLQNKIVMTFGAAAFLTCVGYMIYMNVTEDKRKKTYVTMDEDGGLTSRPKVSKWE
jgi:hypothetical protein